MAGAEGKEARLVRRKGKKGKFNVNRQNLPFRSFFLNLYHTVLDVPWWILFLSFFAFLLVLNTCFATLYYFDVDGISTAATWSDCFFFSVQTFHTTGYGRLNPVSTYVNVLAVIESFLGLTVESLLLGVLFGKLSRASRNRRAILFSSVAVVNNKYASFVSEGKNSYYEVGRYPCLAIRCANCRKPQPCEPRQKLLMIAKKNSFYKFQLLKKYGFGNCPELIEDYGSDNELIICELDHEMNFQYGRAREDLSSMILGIPWIVYHSINETSPLYGMTPEIMRELQVEIVVVLDAVDEAVGNNYQARLSYTIDDIIWNADFGPMISFNQKTQEYDVDFDKINATTILEEELLLPNYTMPLNVPLKESPIGKDDYSPLFANLPFDLAEIAKKPEYYS